MECKEYGLVLILEKKEYIFVFNVKRLNIIKIMQVRTKLLIKSNDILVLAYVILVIYTFVSLKWIENGMKII